MANTAQLIITAKDETQQAIRSVTHALGALESKAVALGPLFAAASAALSFAAFRGAIDGAISFAAKLDDMAASTGATVENLSALAGVAKISGTDLSLVEGGLTKLAKALHSTDEESKGAGKALAAIGLDIGKLRTEDTAEAMLDVAKALAQFENGSGKTAVAVALLGKNGAALLPYLEDLAEKSELVGKVSAEQAAMAEQYEKNMVKLSSSFSVMAKTVSMELLPFLEKLTGEMLDAKESTGSFAKELSGGVRTVLETIAVLGVNVSYVFKGIGTEIGGIAAQMAALSRGDFAGFAAIGDAMKADAARARAEVDSLSARILDRNKAVAESSKETKKSLDGVVTGNESTSDPKQKIDKQKQAYDSLIESLQQKIAVDVAQLQSTEKLTEAEKDYAKYQADLASGALKLSANQRKVVEALHATHLLHSKEAELQKATREKDTLIGDVKRNGEQALERIARQAELNQLSERERQIAEATYRVEDEFAKLRERIIDKVKDETAQKLALAEAEGLLADQKGKVAAATARAYDDQRSFEYGWTKAFQRYEDESTNAAKKAEQVFTSTTSAMTDALAQFATTGKLNFGNMAQSIIANIIRIKIEAQMASVVNGAGNWLSGLFGSVGASPAPTGGATPGVDFLGSGLRKNALGGVYSSPSLSAYSGGVYDSPQVFAFAKGAGVFAEAGPEAIMPLKRDAAGRLGVSADGMGGSGVVINIHNNASGTQATATTRQDAGGKTIIDVMVETVKGALGADIAKGGDFAGLLEGQYGLNRSAGAWR